jgi:DNA-binding XRE family transcriptional regulator
MSISRNMSWSLKIMKARKLFGLPRSRPKLPELGVLGANVRRERGARGITQEKLAEMVEINPRTVQRIEAGKINILVTTVLRPQRALDCPWDALFRELTAESRRGSAVTHTYASKPTRRARAH